MAPKGPNRKLKMSPEEEDILITFMKNNKFLWDMRDVDYKSTTKKYEKWKELSQILSKDVVMIKQRWKIMRDSLRKQKKNELKWSKQTTSKQKTSGDDADETPNKAGENINKMDYLNDCLTQRRKSSNMSVDNSMFLYEDEFSADLNDDHSSTILENLNGQVIISNIKMEETPTDSTSIFSNTPTEFNFIPSKRKNNQQRKQSNSFSEYIAIRKDSNRALQELVQQTNALRQAHMVPAQPEREKTAMEMYFEAYLKDIQTLPSDLQNRCHRELQPVIIQTINEYHAIAEERQIQN